MDRCVLLALVAVNVFVAMSLAEVEVPTKIDTKLVKNFEKINDYLEKNLNSDDLEANVAKAQEWMNEKSTLSLLFDRPFKEALQVFIWLPETVENVTSCGREWSRRLLEKVDEGVSDQIHLTEKNYPLTRIDRILESVAYQHVRLCRLTKKVRPVLHFGFKQFAYDQINEEMVDKVPDNDPETNMQAAENMLKSLEYQEGSYARALKQLLSLKSIQTEDSCNEQGTEIVMKNDLATGAQAYTSTSSTGGYLRRINRVVHYFSAKHSSVCHTTYQKNCLSLLDQLDEQTYRRVLGVASADYIDKEKHDELVADVNGKQVGEDFTTELIVRLDDSRKITGFPGFYVNAIFSYFKAITKQDPRSESLVVVDEKLGKRVLDQDKIKELYHEYIYEPCEKFTNLMESNLEVFNYNWQVLKTSEGKDEEDSGPLNFRLLRSAFQSCKDRVNYQDYYLQEIIGKFEKTY